MFFLSPSLSLVGDYSEGEERFQILVSPARNRTCKVEVQISRVNESCVLGCTQGSIKLTAPTHLTDSWTLRMRYGATAHQTYAYASAPVSLIDRDPHSDTSSAPTHPLLFSLSRPLELE